MRIPVSAPRNIFFNAQNISDTNLTLEQNFNNQIQSGIIQNHFGSGVLPDVLVQHILFNSASAQGLLDGKPINIQSQPSDSNNGNQLEIKVIDSNAAGHRTIKILVVGIDFENNLQYDRFVFDKNETQISSKHYKTILTLLFNDFIGLPTQSFNLGGQIIIEETNPLTLSRDPIMISQDIQPNLFFRDFFVSTGATLAQTLAAALPSYNVDNLNIKIGVNQLRSLLPNDVSSQVAQKFLASTNNIQKITLLLSVTDSVTPSNIIWTGDLLISIFPLQSTVSCPTDIVPQLAIDFDPSNIPIAQLSINYSTLLSMGVQLNSVPQPVDFIFSNTPLASGLVIIPGNYYVVTVKRAGSADTAEIQFATGTNDSTITRETLFNGSVWVDIPDESLWFQVWTDAAKVSDGQAYDAGHGVFVPKTQIDPSTGITVDYVLNKIGFVRNDLYYALLQAVIQDSTPVQDERTGEPVFTEQQFVPSISLLNSIGLSNIQNVSFPLIIGTISDGNIKSYNAFSSTLSASFHEYGIIGNQVVIKVITDPTDGYRYDQNIIELVSEIVNGSIVGAQFVPNVSNPSVFYRIAKAELFTMMYGDVNGDGVIDNNDFILAQYLAGTNLNVIPNYQTYLQQTDLFVADGYLHWQIIDQMSNIVMFGTDGILVPNPSNGAQASFTSATANFNSIVNIGSDTIVISGSVTSPGNNGSFSIINLINNNNITIQKQYYTSDTLLQALRADIDGDMIVDGYDISYINNYINAAQQFPSNVSPINRIGTTFNAIRLTIDGYNSIQFVNEYVDRNDDYPSTVLNRAKNVHTLPDIYLDGYSFFAGRNLKTNPLMFSITKQLIWDAANIVVSAHSRLVPASFGYQMGLLRNKCLLPGSTAQTFPQSNSFDPGRNDFFIPNNLIVDHGGQFIRPDGYYMKLDFEVSTVLFEIPEVSFDTEHSVNLLSDFIADFSGTGYTRLGYPAMRFGDCTTASLNALVLNQIRFGVAVQSFSPQLNGIDPNCLNGIIVDGKIGISVNYSTGLLTLNFTNLYQDPVKQTLNTKVEVTVYLKKAGWNNTPIFVNSIKTQNILGVPNSPPLSIDCPTPPIIIIA
jgi:hypothetical protein